MEVLTIETKNYLEIATKGFSVSNLLVPIDFINHLKTRCAKFLKYFFKNFLLK